jgi:hypothetical protein
MQISLLAPLFLEQFLCRQLGGEEKREQICVNITQIIF